MDSSRDPPPIIMSLLNMQDKIANAVENNEYCHVPAFSSARDTHLSSCEAYKLTCLAVDIDGQLQKERHGDGHDDVLRRAPVALARSRSFYFVYKTM